MTSPACSCQHPAAEVVAGPVIVADGAAGNLTRAAVLTEPFDAPFPTPEYPPAEWFTEPTWVEDWRAEHGLGPSLDPETGVLRLTVTDEGRVGGYFFDFGACIIHDQAACPGPSPTGYAAFHQNEVVVAGGKVLQCGVIGNTHGHASPWIDWKQAQRHYADPNAQMIVCRAGDNERGAWIAGAVVPGLTWGDVAMLRRCALSGDWRSMPPSWWKMNGVTAAAVNAAEGFDCIGPTLVTRPALPLVAGYAASLGGAPTVLLGGAGGVDLEDPADGSPITAEPDGTLRIDQEVAGMARRTTIGPDGAIVIEDETPAEATARARAAAIEEAMTVALDLPLGDPERGWDEDGVRARLTRWATDDEGNLDRARYASAFLWAEGDAEPRFPIADVVDGSLVAMPSGIRAAAAAIHDHHPGVDRALPMDAAAALREALNLYYARMSAALGDAAPEAPWTAAPGDAMPMAEDGGDGAPEDGAPGEPPTREEFDALAVRVQALEEFASAMIEAQVASLVAEDVPIPSPVAAEAERIIAEDVPLPS